MPCYLFTYHGYGTWLPDHPRGFVRRGRGVQEQDVELGYFYRGNLNEKVVSFDDRIQSHLLSAAIEAFHFQELCGHFIATETTHLHILVSWKSNRTWQLVRRQIRSSLSRKLNQELGRRTWFSKQPSRRRVIEQEHFNYLLNVYLPKHSGKQWSKTREQC